VARRPIPASRHRRDYTMRVHLGAYELRKRGAARYEFRDPYYLAVALSWPWFLLLVLCALLMLNGIFGVLYYVQPGSVANARPGAFADDFFFSIETLATVGYGDLYPASFYGHLIASAEVICGMGVITLITGLSFVRFSRPKPDILYADKAVITKHYGRDTLMIRVANRRLTPLTDASARLTALIAETTPEGQFYRTINALKLSQERHPIFALTWTIRHDLDADSPLYRCDPAQIAALDVRLILTIQAQDPVLAADIHGAYTYGPTDILFGMRYADAVSMDTAGRAVADLERISLVEPESGLTAPELSTAPDSPQLS